jgi:SAM-dependent methyltransferase
MTQHVDSTSCVAPKVTDPANSAQERGNRTRPGRLHSRYAVLTLLLEKLSAVVDSDWLKRGDTLLDYGCGNRPYASLFAKKFRRYVGADFPGNPSADVTLGADGIVPLADESVDCVLSTQVLEHVERPATYLGEAYRVLRPGGALVLSTHGIWRYHPDPTDFWRWTIDGLQVEIYRAGFDLWWLQSVFGMASSGVQLWQDATLNRVPGAIRPLYTGLLQQLIMRIERRRGDEPSTDACVYVLLATKRAVR